MDEKRNRFTKSFIAALAVHIAAGILVGIIGWHVAKTPAEVIEITLSSGGGGGHNENAAIQETPLSMPVSADDIVEKNKTLPQKVEQKKEHTLEKQAQPAANKNAVKAEGRGSGQGSGKGSGEGAGAGSGKGEGKGNGIGDGIGEGTPVTPPRLLKMQKPKYPPEARRDEIEGIAYIKIIVNASGQVVSSMIVQSSGNSFLDNAALQAVYNWQFSPAKNTNGIPVACYITVPVNFNLGS